MVFRCAIPAITACAAVGLLVILYVTSPDSNTGRQCEGKLDLLEILNEFREDTLVEYAEKLKVAYGRASPFPHTVIDDLFPKGLIAAVNKEFSDDQQYWIRKYCDMHADGHGLLAELAPEVQVNCYHLKDGLYHNESLAKSLVTKNDMMGPHTKFLFSLMRSPVFIAFLERLTGLTGVIPDPMYLGSGLHQTQSGGLLGIHADFNFHPHVGLDRIINVFLYLNEGWQPSWGGYLELWHKNMSHCGARILPTNNRLAIFSTTDWSWHGHPEPMLSPKDRTRRAIALYFYRKGRPENEIGEAIKSAHSTVFKEAPCSMSGEGSVGPTCKYESGREDHFNFPSTELCHTTN